MIVAMSVSGNVQRVWFDTFKLLFIKLFANTRPYFFLAAMMILPLNTSAAAPFSIENKTIKAAFSYQGIRCLSGACEESGVIQKNEIYYISSKRNVYWYTGEARGVQQALNSQATYVRDVGPNKGKSYTYIFRLSGNAFSATNYSLSTGNYTTYTYHISGSGCAVSVTNKIVPSGINSPDALSPNYVDKYQVLSQSCVVLEGNVQK